jgi:Zn-dependent protease with chaperone function
MTKSPSLAGRAVAAVALLVGFYILAIAVIVGLIAIPVAEWRFAERIDIQIAIACLGAALVVFLSILPRPDRFLPPGPLLEEANQPTLFAVIREVSAQTGQAMPREVYLDPDLNAYVAQRGGIMGFGSRRIMGLGLPLLQLLSVSELKAILAHEFGHFHGGDTALGPWIYKTRSALARTIQSLAESRSILTYLFDWYGKAFLRITLAISRRQEFAADALAARTVGAAPMVGGLRMLHGGAKTFYSYWNHEVIPVIERGYAPPYGTGFRRLMQQPVVEREVEAAIEEELRSAKVNPLDSHPPLNERLRALADLPPGPAGAETTPAISLLSNSEALEQQLLQLIAARTGRKLSPISWADTAEKVWVTNWVELVKRSRSRLADLTPSRFQTIAKDLTQLAVALQFAARRDLVMQEHREAALSVAGAAIGLALRSRGWTVSAEPGEDVFLVKNGNRFSPFAAIRALGDHSIDAETWNRMIGEIGISEVDLASTWES